MLKLGEKIISDIYLGDKKIAKVLLGNKLVYQSGQPIFLEYIEFDGASWIATEIKPIFGDELEITAQIGEAVAGKNYVLFGTGTSSIQFTGLIETNRVFNRYFGSTAGRSTGQDSSKIFHTYLFKNDGSVYQNGKLITSPFTVTEATVNSNLTIGTRGYDTEYWLGNISSVKLISAVGAVKLDLRPCIDPKGVVCFYDMVSKKYFYNKGTGTLTAGNVIKFVDYIVFDGNSYIDTGYKPNSNSSVSVTYNPHYNSVFSCIFGTQDSTDTNRFYALISSTLYRLQVNSCKSSTAYFGISENGLVTNSNGTFTSKQQKVELKIDNYNKQIAIKSDELTKTYNTEQYSSTHHTPECNYSMLLGDRSSGGVPSTSNKFKGEIYGFEIRESGELIQDLKPCVVNGEACFYDTVTGKIFTNAGTGTLKANPRFVTSILFDGNSYIDTGIAHQTCIVECDIRFENTGTRQLMGFGTSTAQYWGAGATGTFDYVNNTDATVKNNLVIQFNTDNPTAPTKIMFLNGTQIGGVSTGSSISNYTYIIGAAGTNVKSYYMTGEVWGNKFTANGVVIQDLRPYVDADGVACFKDVVTGNLFYNQGTGTLGYTE